MAEAAQVAPGADSEAPVSPGRETSLPKIEKKSKFSSTTPAPRASTMNTTALPPVKSALAKTVPANVSTERGVYEKTTTCNWKDNDDISTWFKKKEKMDRERRSRPARLAMKDANWILARREKQMKSIQRRQKQEKMMLKEEERNPKGKGKPVLKPRPSMKPQGPSAAALHFQDTGQKLMATTAAVLGMGHHMQHENKFARLRPGQLEWQKPPPLPPDQRVSKDRATSVWVMPGVFTTKTVTHI